MKVGVYCREIWREAGHIVNEKKSKTREECAWESVRENIDT
jgi:hypothetical protein